MDTIMGISFARPAALLLLLLLVPLTVYLSRTSLALLRRRTRGISLGLRLAVIALLVLALAGLEIDRTTDRLSVVFLLDRSDSMSADQKVSEAQYVRDTVGRMGQNDQVGVIEFG